MISVLDTSHSHAVCPKKEYLLRGRAEMGEWLGHENENPRSLPCSSIWWVGMGVMVEPGAPRIMLSHVLFSSALRPCREHERSMVPGSDGSVMATVDMYPNTLCFTDVYYKPNHKTSNLSRLIHLIPFFLNSVEARDICFLGAVITEPVQIP